MHTITLYDAPGADDSAVSHTFRYPGSWEELQPGQLMAVTTAQASNSSDTGVRFDLLRDLAGIPAELMARMPPAADLMVEVDVTDRSGPWKPVEKREWRLLPSLDWAFAEPCYRKSLLPTIEHKGTSWIGPDDGFDHMTLNQWVYCTTLLKTFQSAKEADASKALNDFMGALYQPTGQPWSYEGIESFAEQLADVPVATKLAAVVNYRAIHSTLPLLYKRVFDPTGEVMDSPQGLFSIVHDAASSVAFADMNNAEKQLLHKVLGYTEHNLHKDEKNAAAAKQKTS